MGVIRQEFPQIKPTNLNTNVAYVINTAAIEIPPMLNRSVDQLYLLGEAGKSIMQLYSVMMQYNSLIKRLCDEAIKDVSSFNPSKAADNLNGHLRVIGTDIAAAEKQIEAFHD
jgi:hypothetical protein